MRKINILEDDKKIYDGNFYVNTAILKGRIPQDPQKLKNGVRFSIQLSNGKNDETGEWNKPTFANCIAFGEVGDKIFDEYKAKSEIWIIGKFYSKKHEDKTYCGFTVREIVTPQEIEEAGNEFLEDCDLPF